MTCIDRFASDNNKKGKVEKGREIFKIFKEMTIGILKKKKLNLKLFDR